MSARVVARQTIESQRKASDPRISAWVSAHAGSGKTHVLAQRVVRLLLAHAAPSHILCLTYTKAAAANMSARIFGMLARWTTLDDEALAREIGELGEGAPSRADLDFARRLFARAVETPGGLKIQTIHAFCEKLLHIFPFEANVPAGFRVVDDMAQAELLEQARRRALERATRTAGTLHNAVTRVARETTRAGFDQLCREIVALRIAYADVADLEEYAERVRQILGLRPGENLEGVERDIIFGGEPPDEWPSLVRLLQTGSASDAELAFHLDVACARAPDPECIESYLAVFFTQKGEPRGVKKNKIITKALSESEPALLARMEAERDRLAPLIEKRKAAVAFERALALARIADAILEEYARAKRYRGVLDYDDLIEGARRLLHRSSPSWVLYKLDAQIEHVLLDEAQDTSAAQWDILNAIADEFCAGASRRVRGPARSLFAVGDKKQSIFSFQGAAPEKFDAMRRQFDNRFKAAERPFEWVRLVQSFRSAPGVLETVDTVFKFGDNGFGLSQDRDELWQDHEACKVGAASLVEIWDVIAPEEKEEPEDWRLPLDLKSRKDPTEVLARKIARKIAWLVDPQNGECVEDGGELRPARAGDILVLVRKRGALFEAINRALKAERVPVAGADRLAVAQHIAVEDLVALGRAALLPDDDLTFATLLKTPLFGLTDEDLIAIAPHRKGSLHAALRNADDMMHRDAAARFERWRRDAATLSPFDFYSRVLGTGGGRTALVARLGAEANDAIDEFLRLALDFEREQPTSLTLFLSMVETLDLSIKRDMETSGDAVRVMTAHAAKGLEAKIVFLPDTCGAPTGQHDPKLYAIGDDEPVVLWSAGKTSDPPMIETAREALRQAERDEHQRLLYVALTRAEERLYIAGCHGPRGRAKGCWYDAIRDALESACESVADPLEPEQTILTRGAAPRRHDIVATIPALAAEHVIPAFARTPAPKESVFAPPLRPSSALAGADAVVLPDAAAPSRDAAERLLVGRLTHALLQHLPDCAPERRTDAARRFLDMRGPVLPAARRSAIASAALAIVADARLAALFGADSAPEVDIVATLKDGVRVSGRIDRLAVTRDEALIAEFKTGQRRAQTAPLHLRQLALYHAAVAPLYPGRRLRCFIVWTQTAEIEEPDDAALDIALAQATGAA